MIKNRFIFPILAAFAVIYTIDFIVHGVILANWYQRTTVLWRSPEIVHMWLMFASQFVFAIVFVYIFSTNYQNRGPSEGVRYGLCMGTLLATIDIGTYCYLPMPVELIMAWVLASYAKSILGGVALALVYRE